MDSVTAQLADARALRPRRQVWCDARAVAMRSTGGTLTHIHCSFPGWPDEWDEWKQFASGHVRWAVGWQREAWEI